MFQLRQCSYPVISISPEAATTVVPGQHARNHLVASDSPDRSDIKGGVEEDVEGVVRGAGDVPSQVDTGPGFADRPGSSHTPCIYSERAQGRRICRWLGGKGPGIYRRIDKHEGRYPPSWLCKSQWARVNMSQVATTEHCTKGGTIWLADRLADLAGPMRPQPPLEAVSAPWTLVAREAWHAGHDVYVWQIMRRTVGRLRDEHNIQKLDGQRKRLISGNGCWLECGLALAGIDLCILRPMNCGARGGAEEAVYLSHSMRPGKSKHSGGTRVCASHIPSTRRALQGILGKQTSASTIEVATFVKFGVEDVRGLSQVLTRWCIERTAYRTDRTLIVSISGSWIWHTGMARHPGRRQSRTDEPPIAIVETEARVGPDGHSCPGRIHKFLSHLQCLDVEHGAHANIASDVIRYIKATTRDWEEQWHKLLVCEREFRKIAGRGSWQRV
ncbi:hypothetical protein FOMPIDRAFT_1020058 [Fomitopsis schrenkii]|uniref:Uncharacterized protein n=1 Tax=Fomitopsis schrenkii TaxID=2126942 RepID=S8F6A3_FOMSC|nr:hypothetical protein FOMPIDRAFT_1020058 [Fomitopsis schrenkii]